MGVGTRVWVCANLSWLETTHFFYVRSIVMLITSDHMICHCYECSIYIYDNEDDDDINDDNNYTLAYTFVHITRTHSHL